MILTVCVLWLTSMVFWWQAWIAVDLTEQALQPLPLLVPLHCNLQRCWRAFCCCQACLVRNALLHRKLVVSTALLFAAHRVVDRLACAHKVAKRTCDSSEGKSSACMSSSSCGAQTNKPEKSTIPSWTALFMPVSRPCSSWKRFEDASGPHAFPAYCNVVTTGALPTGAELVSGDHLGVQQVISSH